MGRPEDSREREVKLLRGSTFGKDAGYREDLLVHEAINIDRNSEVSSTKLMLNVDLC